MALYKFQGRKPIPDAQKKLEAGGGKYYNNRPINDDLHLTIPEATTVFSPPKGLLKGLALKEYTRMKKLVMRDKVISQIDHVFLEAYALAYGNLYDPVTGYEKLLQQKLDRRDRKALSSLATSEFNKMRVAASEIGIGIVNRSRIPVASKSKKGKGEELLS